MGRSALEISQSPGGAKKNEFQSVSLEDKIMPGNHLFSRAIQNW